MKLLKNLIPAAAALMALLLTAGCNQGKKAPAAPPAKTFEEADFSVLTAANHPRVFADAATFKNIKKSLKKNALLANLHDQMMQKAEQYGLAEEPLAYKKDESNKRILHVSNAAVNRISAAAYAYRMTGDKKYLAHAEKDINDVCNFPDWNPSHFLDTGEMALAVAIGYDWLYDVLSPETKKKVEETLVKYAFEASNDRWFYNASNNWNQVCNAGLVSAALAIWETNPEICKAQVAKSIESNKLPLKAGYDPDGAYPEGSGYWGYGTGFQCILIAALESALGSDFGICDSPGFDKTADYELHTIGNTLKRFNYSDCGEGKGGISSMMFFATRFNKPYLLYFERPDIENGGYVNDRTLFVGLTSIAKSNISEIPVPPENMFSGKGDTPVAMMRTGWGEKDLYLGIKGGKGAGPHGHMDSGNFVFDAYGYRWASDYGAPPYAKFEAYFIKNGTGESDLWNMGPESKRWDLFPYNNKAHNTITINDSKFDTGSFTPLTAVENTASRKSATFDMTSCYFGNVQSAVRTAAIVDNAYLEIKDDLKGGAKPASVRWTFITKAQPEITADGIVLTQGDVKMKLHAEGAAVTYKSWPTDAKSLGLAGEEVAPHIAGSYVIGYELPLQKNAEVNLVTTLKKI